MSRRARRASFGIDAVVAKQRASLAATVALAERLQPAPPLHVADPVPVLVPAPPRAAAGLTRQELQELVERWAPPLRVATKQSFPGGVS